MTVEIRQLVIKSDVGEEPRNEAAKPAGRDEECCGVGVAADSASPESRRLRAQLAAELERLRER